MNSNSRSSSSSSDYKQKYIKYKNKYLKLKASEEQKQKQIQSGGYMYSSGEYIFFIPEKTSNFDKQEYGESNGKISSLDKFTDNLGNCTRFLRIGANVNNKTIYSNQSFTDVVKRETMKIENKTMDVYNVVKDKSQKAWNASQPYVDNVLDITKQSGQAIANVGKQGYETAKEGYGDIIKKLESNNKDESKKQLGSSNNTYGGANEESNDNCNKLPIPLPENLKGFSFDNEVNETSLVDYIKLINEKQGGDKITRVIVVQKKTNSFGFGGESRLKYNFDVKYDGDKIIAIKK